MKYAGFFRRLAAFTVDLVVLVPSLGAMFWIVSNSRTTAIFLYVPLLFLMMFYRVYFIGRWGQTVGKMAMGIKVVQVNGEVAGFARATYREGVNIVIAVVSGSLLFLAMLSVSSAEFEALKFMDKFLRLEAAIPPWGNKFSAISNWWNLPDALVLLFNAKRRAVHDFIAGTVVIHVDKSPNVV